MSKVNIFEVALRMKFRFNFRGLISVEDLWTLSVEELDLIYRDLSSHKRKEAEDSLLDIRSVESFEIDTKIEIIKHIVKVKMDEADQKVSAKLNQDRKDKIKAILANKEDQALENLSEEELRDMLREM